MDPDQGRKGPSVRAVQPKEKYSAMSKDRQRLGVSGMGTVGSKDRF